ncbi:MAG: NADH-quinone oxidoreductase subunit J, partial [Candidatus Puniceispirillales bacterium]
MMIAPLFFYLFALMTVVSGLMVIVARNPVHSVLFLILSFFNSAGLFVLLGAEFLAMLLVVVYVGAVAVLFLFVVMMLDINIDEMRQGFRQNLPLGLVVGLILIVELLMIFTQDVSSSNVLATGISGEQSNTAMIGAVLYTENLLNFQVAGLILLVAMIGAITLTMRHREGVKRQVISVQNSRSREETVQIVSVDSHVAPKVLE